MPVPIKLPAPIPCTPRIASRRRGSLAVGCQELPTRLTTRRCSVGRICIEADDEALTVFSKYQSGFARRLKKPEAISMFVKEFELETEDAEAMFGVFDKDSNDLLSLWEFRQFYQTVGKNARNLVELFKGLEVDNTGKIDIAKAFDKLQEIESGKGKLTDTEIENFLKSAAGEAKEIDFGKFLNLMAQIRLYKG